MNQDQESLLSYLHKAGSLGSNLALLLMMRAGTGAVSFVCLGYFDDELMVLVPVIRSLAAEGSEAFSTVPGRW